MSRINNRALIHGEVDPRPVDPSTQHVHTTEQEETPTHPRVNFLRTHLATTATTTEIINKIKEL
jgi:hypothetical protein